MLGRGYNLIWPSQLRLLDQEEIFRKDGLRDRLPIFSRKTMFSPCAKLEPAQAVYGDHISKSKKEPASIRLRVYTRQALGFNLSMQIRNSHTEMMSLFAVKI